MRSRTSRRSSSLASRLGRSDKTVGGDEVYNGGDGLHRRRRTAMGNGQACCILGVCCPPGSAAQLEALTTALAEGTGRMPAEARVYADYILSTYDLAPRGSLGDFKAAIAKMAGKGKP